MITKEDLARWQQVKNNAITQQALTDEDVIGIQEMYVELKQLRKENFRVVEVAETMNLMSKYIRTTKQENFISDKLEILFEQIEAQSEHYNLNLELHND